MLAGRPARQQLCPARKTEEPLKSWIAAVALAFLAAPVAAQAPGSVLLAPGSTRALALGDAFVLGSPDSDAIFYNAASLPSAGVSAGFEKYEDARAFGASAALEWLGARIGIGLRSAGTAGGGDETELAGAASREVLGVRLGVTAKVLERRASGARAGGVAADVSVGAEVGPLRLGLAARDLGADIESDEAAVAGAWPTRVVLAAATRALPIGPFDVTLAARAGGEKVDEVVSGGGVEVAYWPIQGRTFAARAGTIRDAAGNTTWTFGGGFAGDRISLDYAFADTGDGVHRITVRWR